MLAAGWRGAGVVKAPVEDVNLRPNWEVWADGRLPHCHSSD